MQQRLYPYNNANPMMMMAGLHQAQAGGNMGMPMHWQPQQQQLQQASPYRSAGTAQQQVNNTMVQMGYPVGSSSNNVGLAASGGSQQQSQGSQGMTQQQQQAMYYAAPAQYYSR